MKMCQVHWRALQDAVRSAGMWHLVSRDGATVAELFTKAERGEQVSELEGFDPLLHACFMIMGKGLEHGGLYLMQPAPDGSEYCPVCEAIKHKPADVTNERALAYWINGPVDSLLERARSLGLVPKVS